MKTLDTVRPSPIAGRWYPGEASQLGDGVDGYIQAAHPPPFSGRVVAIIAPHAGHIYSGPVAGYAFKVVQGLRPELVAVVSPMHHPYPYALLTSLHRAYWTPLGEIPVAREVVEAMDQALISRLGYGLTPVAQDPEHSLEIELPFLQCALAGPFRLLPVMVRQQSVEVARALGQSLAQVIGATNALLVASTDLSHFYPQDIAKKLDGELMRRVAAFDPQSVLEAEDEGVGFACGRGALAAVMWAAKGLGATRVELLHHATSGDVTGDHREVVGYGAAVILKDV